MNRYSLWVYVTVATALVIGFIYALPNFYGETPAVQISSARATVRVDPQVLKRAEEALAKGNVASTGVVMDANSIRIRFANVDTQAKARDILDHALNPDAKNADFTVALNLMSNSPNWLTALHALPMYLGLDLRGGVHFLYRVDLDAAVKKRLDGMVAQYLGDGVLA